MADTAHLPSTSASIRDLLCARGPCDGLDDMQPHRLTPCRRRITPWVYRYAPEPRLRFPNTI